MARRLPETLADYLVVAIAPILIGLLVGSLMYFLVFAFYEGDQAFRLLWVMTMFVIATVGIARISMEEGLAYASLFAFPLAGALALVLPPTGWPLLALVWWATHKLTWDCTLADDTQDASGQGLLQQMGLENSDPKVGQRGPSLASATNNSTSQSTAEPTIEDGVTAPPSSPTAWFERLWLPDKRPHAPGVWVVYFSLAALPLFGLGSWFITDITVRQKAFWLLVIYVASGMSLLAATSFLGLRRYLRQRHIEMPLEMTATWLTTGGLLIVAMLIVATILPRPSREYSLTQLPFAVAWTVRKASQIAPLPGGIKDSSQKHATETKDSDESESAATKSDAKNKQSGQNSDKSSKDSKSSASGEKGKQGNQSSSGDEKSSKSSKSADRQSSPKKDSSKKSDGQKESSTSKSEGKTKEQSKSESNDNSRADTPPPDPSPPPQSSPGQTISQITASISQSIGWIFRLVFYAALLIGGVVLIVIYREELLAALRKLLDELRELWAVWFGGSKPAVIVTAPIAMPKSRPFSTFHDPFLTGAAQQMSWVELVNYSFAAAEAWAIERSVPRLPDQTPLEFAGQLGRALPQLAAPAQTLANSYSQLAYAKQTASAGPVESLRKLWQVLTQPPAPEGAAAEINGEPRETRSSPPGHHAALPR